LQLFYGNKIMNRDIDKYNILCYNNIMTCKRLNKVLKLLLFMLFLGLVNSCAVSISDGFDSAYGEVDYGSGSSLYLQNIEFDSGISLNETIDENTTEYTADIGVGLSSFKFTSIVASFGDASVKINDVAYNSNTSYPLDLGDNDFEIEISKESVSQTYYLTITRGKNVIDYIKASNTGGSDYFGFSVDIDGDTIVVGAYLEDSVATGINGDDTDDTAGASGAAYVFKRSGSTWSQEAYLKPSNTQAGDHYGYRVAVDGDTVVVGARYESSNATGVNGDDSNDLASDSGAAYVYKRSGTTWTQEAYLKASNTDNEDHFGSRVDIDGDTIIVSARSEDSNATGVNGDDTDDSAGESGAVYVFKRSGSTWSQEAYLKASNTAGTNYFGIDIAIDADTIVIGAHGEDSDSTGVNGDDTNSGANNSGAAYVFKRSGTTWTQEAYLKASNAEADDNFGVGVAVSGDTIVVGSRYESSSATGVNGDDTDNSSSDSGAAYVFKRSGTTWTQEAYLKASNTASDERFGFAVGVSGDTIVVGAYQEDSSATGINGDDTDNSAGESGAAYIFKRKEDVWSQEAYLKASNTGGTDSFGINLSIDEDTVVVGAYFEDSNATGVNGDGTDNTAGNSGAVYVFE
jgi:hypothetical protein